MQKRVVYCEYDTAQRISSPGRPHGSHKRLFSYADLGFLFQVREQTVRGWFAKNGVLNGADLRRVVGFYLERREVCTFTWSDLEAAFGRSKRQLQRWAARGDFDPADFASVAKLLRARSGLRPSLDDEKTKT